MSMPSSVLNTNLASMIAQRNLGSAQTRLAESVERLSSGLRINRAKDDAAGIAVASVIEGQTRITGTAHRNINDAMSMVQTAEGALQEASSILTRIKELATQGANDSLSREQYYFLVQEMRQQLEELANTADRTTFNGNKLLGGGPNATRQVTTTTTTTQTTGVAQNTWTSVDSSGLLTGITGSNQIRVVVEVTDGNIKLESIPSGVNASISGYGNATDGTAVAIAVEGSKAAVTAALAALRAKRTGSGNADIELEVYELVPRNQQGNQGQPSGLIRLDTNSFKATAGKVTFDTGGTNPNYSITDQTLGPINISSKGWFAGQTRNGNTLVGAPHSPLALDPSSSNVFVTRDGANPTSPVLSGFPTFNGPISFLFDVPVAAVGLTGGYFDAVAGTAVEAFDDSGNSLGLFTNSQIGIEFFGLATSAGTNIIKGIAFHIVGNEPAGFALDNLTVGSAASLNTGVLFTPTLRNSLSRTLEPERTTTTTRVITTTEPAPVEYNAWEFLSGAGTGDAIRLEGIPIWDTAEGAAERNNGQGYAGDSVRVGALNALYRRIVWLSDQVNGPLQTGQGFNIFSKSALAGC